MTAGQVAELAAGGDPIAQAVMGEALDALAEVLARLAETLDLGGIILGGPLGLAERHVLDPLAARLRATCASANTLPPLLAAELEPDAALIGAIIAAQEHADRLDPG
jgi:predicted NBD/HSP70 family sugar kinase